jgi:hypothetical protein
LWKAKKSGMKTEDFWSTFVISDEPNIDLLQLVELFLVVVLSSVECERLFSAMNLTKDKMRTRILADLLNDLMMIKLNGPQCHGKDSPFDPEALTCLIDRAYTMWKQRKVRCVKLSHTAPRLYARKKQKSDMEAVKLERTAGESSDDEDEDECQCGATDLETGTILDPMNTFTSRRIMVVPGGWKLVVGLTLQVTDPQLILDQANKNLVINKSKLLYSSQMDGMWMVGV